MEMALRGRGFSLEEIDNMDLFRLRSYMDILTARPGKGGSKGGGTTTRYVVKKR